MSEKMSQCQVIGMPRVRTWSDYREGCLATYGGGYRDDLRQEAFQHGMITVFNLLEAEFPPAEQCQALPECLEALKRTIPQLDVALHTTESAKATLAAVKAALAKAGVGGAE